MAEERAPELAALRHDDEFDRALAALKELSGRELRSGEVRAVMHGAQAARRAKQWEREMRPLRRAEQDVCKAHNKKCSE